MAKEVIYRKDYKAPDFLVDNVSLEFDLHESKTLVKSRIEFKKSNADATDCVLYADDLIFISVSMNGELLSIDDYILSENELVVKNAPDEFFLEVENEINPKANTSLSGLYYSSGNLTTQCEAQGFRRITYYPDRPDVMAKFEVTLRGNKENYPILLSNGNLIDSGNLEDGRHFAKYEDPFKKPSYLFALVAGKLDHIEDSFTTMSGKKVALKIFCNPGNVNKCYHAMASLKKAMKWDEETYGREYDLDIFNVVFVDDFNAGAMENKSLNIFNSSCALADPITAVDAEYQFIETIIGHEYFHNWTGDRITCRSWFELTLKEGLTVFRHESFGESVQDRDVNRIGDVVKLRNIQLPEDLSPMAHSIRPDSFVEIENFYTGTVYEKGAEVIRMMKTIIGDENFRKATDLYFEKFDGQAVACDDFVSCMAEASGFDFTHFKLWYSQAGTPIVTSTGEWDKINRTYKITLTQENKPTNNQKEKLPLFIPVKMGILNHEGQEIDLILNGKNLGKETVLHFTEEKTEFVFEEVHSQPVYSLFRDFSAPIIHKNKLEDEDKYFLVKHDTNPFCRWDILQQLSMDILLKSIHDEMVEVPENFIEAFRIILSDENISNSMKATLLTLPSEKEIESNCEFIDHQIIHKVRQEFISLISIKLHEEMMDVFGETYSKKEYDVSAEEIGRRSLHNICLSYLCANGEKGSIHLAEHQYFHADNMTDQYSALNILVSKAGERTAEIVLDNFYDLYKDDISGFNKWLSAQARRDIDNITDKLREIMQYEKFSITNPNNVRRLMGSFAMFNANRFHTEEGYKFLTDVLISLNTINPNIASGLVDHMCSFSKFKEENKEIILRELKRLRSIDKLAPNLQEKIDNALKAV